MDFLSLKFYGIVWSCSFAPSWSFAYLPRMGLPVRQIIIWRGMHIWNYCTSFIQIRSIWICLMSVCALSWLSWHGAINGLYIVCSVGWWVSFTEQLVIFPKIYSIWHGLTHPPWCRIYASVNCVCIGSKSHSLSQCWDIVNWPLGANFCEILTAVHIF